MNGITNTVGAGCTDLTASKSPSVIQAQGLDDEIADKVFSTFVTTKADGIGVGLSICKSIVEAHGGELLIRQRPGGATFSFVLPTDREKAEI